MKFSELALKPKLLEAIEKHGYETAMPVQVETIQAFNTGKHIVCQSQTGSGKTAAFCLPIMNAVDIESKSVQALILCPTRELATQTQEEVYKLSFGMFGLRSCCVYGGSNIHKQRERLQQGCQIVVGTPGRVIDLIERRMLDVSNLEYLVLDEADRMLDMGFVDDVERIRQQASKIKQVMSFSATVTSELRDLLHQHIGSDYASIKMQTEVVVSKIDHSFMMVNHGSKVDMLDKYLETHRDQKVVIFVQMKAHTEQLQENLRHLGHEAYALHGDMRQYDRNMTIKAYKNGDAKILIATDVASRGLNLNDIELVVNLDVPQDPESYIHRIGRTGRAGKSGKAITLVDSREMRLLEMVEKKNKITIKQIDEYGNEIARPTARSRSGGSNGRSGGSSRGGYRSAPRGNRNPGQRSDDRGGRDGGQRAPSRFGDRGGRDSGSRFGSRDTAETGAREPRRDSGQEAPSRFAGRDSGRDGGQRAHSRFGDRGGRDSGREAPARFPRNPNSRFASRSSGSEGAAPAPRTDRRPSKRDW